MTDPTRFVSATPLPASLDIERSVEFYCSRPGFAQIHVQQASHGIVSRGAVHGHCWACAERHIAENTGCRVRSKASPRCSRSVRHSTSSTRTQRWKPDPGARLSSVCSTPTASS